MKKSSKKSENGAPEVSTAPNNVVSSPKSSKSPKKTDISKMVTFKIRMLDSVQPHLEIALTKTDIGSKLLDEVCEKLGGVVERDYFGLRFTDRHNQRQWLELGRSVYKQMKGSRSFGLSFRVKHYPTDPIYDFKQEIARYLLYLQIRRDLLQGRLLCSGAEMYGLGAMILQAELGDAPNAGEQLTPDKSIHSQESITDTNGFEQSQLFDSTPSPTSPLTPSSEDIEFDSSYVRKLRILFAQSKKAEVEVAKVHRTLCGLTASEAETTVLERASQLPTYGVDPFLVKPMHKTLPPISSDQTSVRITSATASLFSGEIENPSSDSSALPTTSLPALTELTTTGAVYVGLTSSGIMTFVGLQSSRHYTWEQINRVACDGKDFLVYIKSEKKPKSCLLTYCCETKAAALALWKWTIDRKCFFTLKEATQAKITKTSSGFFRRSHSYRFLGMSQSEMKAKTPSKEVISQPNFTRAASLRRYASSNTPSNNKSRYATLPVAFGRGVDNSSSKRPELPIELTQSQLEETQLQASLTRPSNLDGLNSIEHEAEVSKRTPDLFNKVETPIRPEAVCTEFRMPTPTMVEGLITAQVVTSENTAPLKSLSRQEEASTTCLSRETPVISKRTNNVAAHGVKGKLSNGEIANSSQEVDQPFYKSSVLWQTLELATVFFGLVCFVAVIAALETRPQPGQHVDMNSAWSVVGDRLRNQPAISAFDDYVYGPLRNHFASGIRSLGSVFGQK